MVVTRFWVNLVLFLLVIVALGLSIWAFTTPYKKDKFGDCPIKETDLLLPTTLENLNKMCKELDCTNLGTIYINSYWVAKNVGQSGCPSYKLDYKLGKKTKSPPYSPPPLP